MTPLLPYLRARLDACSVTGPVVVGLSGGLDSTVLLDALVQLGEDVRAVHVHHHLRGADADADAAHAHTLCQSRGVPFTQVDADAAPPAGRQAWGRALRLRAFADAARTCGAAFVLTAHHADDQAETVLLALLRGTGVRGLAGMAEARHFADGLTLVRPLLALPRAHLRAYAEAHRLTWREDAANADLRYRRAALRHTVLPALDALVPGAAARIARAAAAVQAERHLAAPARAALLARALVPTPLGGRVHAEALAGLPEALRHAVLLDAARRFLPGLPVSARLAARLDALLDAPVGRLLWHPAGHVYRLRMGLGFAQPTVFVPSQLDAGASVTVPGGMLTLAETAAPERFDRNPAVAYFDAERLTRPLTVRRWQPGDRMQPFGLAHAVAVSNLLTNARVEPDVRAQQPVVMDAAGALVLLPGVRAAAVAPVTPETRRVLRLVWTPGRA